ncbi:MAG: hypothetical protein HWQ41_10455 [Nostoc sp. NOS(2021)]|uniref:hypothetical protein n=1 Tax=Nostoc sp. NOS(2021) TaxID=2815407 RepID=UPI0025F12152|nr:hypothetical protein [Nostoc sp. NOS(2021)]MBN3895666.1 hypothetical protein [Nostoc sp. NOS(2021)]
MISNVNFTKKHWDYIDKTDTSWSHFDECFIVLTKTEELPSFDAIPRVKQLVQKLTEVANVNKVRAIALRFPDIHWIDFELELQSETELSHELWEIVQNLVIDCEWKLRDDSGEKWYFHAEPVNRFSKLREGSRVIDNSDNKQTLTGRQISSSHLNLVVG